MSTLCARRVLAVAAGAVLTLLIATGPGSADTAAGAREGGRSREPGLPSAQRAHAEDGGVCSPGWLGLLGTATHTGAGVRAVPEPSTVGSRLLPTPETLLGTTDGLQQAAVHGANDTYFRLYQRESLMAMGALDAWETSRGGPDVVIAVISTGVHYTHTDLAAKIWRNPGEVPGNGLDDDGNGYVDDMHGWSFPDDSAGPVDGPLGRGTMMAGIAAAHTNNDEGVAGVSWGARIMPLRTMVLDPTGTSFEGRVADQVEAVCYAANNGARVILIGGYLFDPANVATDVERLRQALEYAHTRGSVVVAPAGDCALPQGFCPPDQKYGTNPQIFPAAFRYVIGVQTYGSGITARPEASYGSWVDITAPGEEFMTTYSEPPYKYVKHQAATSDFGAAHVAGVVAVLRSINPDLSPYQVEQVLGSTADRPKDVPFDYPGDGLPRNERWGYGVLNFERAVESVPPRIRVEAISAVSPPSTTGGRQQLSQMTDGANPPTPLQFANPYLSAGAWELTTDAAWVGDADARDRLDGSSTSTTAADLEVLQAETGPLQQGRVYTAGIQACATGWSRERSPCQLFPYRLTVVDDLERRYLPFVALPRAQR